MELRDGGRWSSQNRVLDRKVWRVGSGDRQGPPSRTWVTDQNTHIQKLPKAGENHPKGIANSTQSRSRAGNTASSHQPCNSHHIIHGALGRTLRRVLWRLSRPRLNTSHKGKNESRSNDVVLVSRQTNRWMKQNRVQN